ncbi:MAG: HEAT repeat domain-containing protein [Gemmataceae bacterium]|nr:HEAT repeat domain-containing protein [Gemmataceae bacterium]
MPQLLTQARRLCRTCAVYCAGAGLTSLGLCGCAGFWDDVTSRKFEFSNLFSRPDPLIVLRDSNDGDERARALRALREPKQYSGSDAEQDVVVNVLVTAAKSDPQPLCRLAAVQTLGKFKDPRAVQGLVDAYFAVNVDQRRGAPVRLDSNPYKGIPPETATIIQVQALTSLGETKSPAAVELLARVARPEPGGSEGMAELEKQQIMDVKIAAVRALANFSHYQATESLLLVLQKEKDVAVRDRAVESLQAATGKKHGDDPKAWEDVLHQQSTPGAAPVVAEDRDNKTIKRVSAP